MTQNQKPRTYIAIDLKSFYASVECRERKLNPMTTNLVVADGERTTKTICLAVSPSLKAHGIFLVGSPLNGSTNDKHIDRQQRRRPQ